MTASVAHIRLEARQRWFVRPAMALAWIIVALCPVARQPRATELLAGFIAKIGVRVVVARA